MTRRLAILGPHRRRTGTGPFVAEFFRRSGCAVQTWNREQAQRFLDPASRFPDVDAVAICSPAETHFDYLQAALDKGLHVFCEKPIVWPPDHSVATFRTLIAQLAEALDLASQKRLVVHENTQWVYTLEQFRSIARDLAPERIRRFRCELAPSSGAAPEMIMECAAHANSLLLALGCHEVEEPRLTFAGGSGSEGAVLDIAFRSRGPAGGPVQVEYCFAQQAVQPRHAAYQVNDFRAERRVDLDGYRIFLKIGSHEYAIRDPLQSSVEEFVRKISEMPSRRDDLSTISSNISMSCSFLDAYYKLAEPPQA